MTGPKRRPRKAPKGHKDTQCPGCGGSKDRLSRIERVGSRKCRRCPCGHIYYWTSMGLEFSAAMDAYAEGTISADELVQAGFDQEFADITDEQP